MSRPMPRVLVVDDDPLIRMTVSDVLEDEGYEVEQASDGAQALEAVRRGLPAAIVLDLMMPVLDGWGFVDACRAAGLCDGTPVVVISAAHGLHDTAERLRSKGVRAVLAKPFDVDALVGVIARFAPLTPRAQAS